MRSRITKRAHHTSTHARRISGLRHAVRNLSGAYVAPGIFEARAPATTKSAPPDAPRNERLAGGSATLWTLPTSEPNSDANRPTALAPSSMAAAASRAPRQRTGITSVPVDWSAVRRYQSV